jgi:uncharacterized protein (TIGR02118 family)
MQCLTLLGHLAEWWLTQHRDLALKLPKIRRYAVNLVRVAPGDPEPAYDGVAELWFDKEEDLFAAYKTDIGKAVAEDSLARVVSFVYRGFSFDTLCQTVLAHVRRDSAVVSSLAFSVRTPETTYKTYSLASAKFSASINSLKTPRCDNLQTTSLTCSANARLQCPPSSSTTHNAGVLVHFIPAQSRLRVKPCSG